MIWLDLDDLAVDGCITKAPGGGEAAGRSPVDRGKQGLKRSIVTDGAGIPLHVVSAGANRHDSPLLAPTLAGPDELDHLPDDVIVHLDRGYDSNVTRAARCARLRWRHRPQRNAPFMRYDAYLAAGWPIGTGVIEGACGHLVKDRMEQAGLRWT